MKLQSQREVENTRAKLKELEDRYSRLQAQPAVSGQEKVREWTLLSLKKLINQFKEEIARFEAHVGGR
jgi:flagellar biosynthesis chaperone FliJ